MTTMTTITTGSGTTVAMTMTSKRSYVLFYNGATLPPLVAAFGNIINVGVHQTDQIKCSYERCRDSFVIFNLYMYFYVTLHKDASGSTEKKNCEMKFKIINYKGAEQDEKCLSD